MKLNQVAVGVALTVAGIIGYVITSNGATKNDTLKQPLTKTDSAPTNYSTTTSTSSSSGVQPQSFKMDVQAYVKVASSMDWHASPKKIYSELNPVAQQLQSDLEMMNPAQVGKAWMALGSVVGDCNSIKFQLDHNGSLSFIKSSIIQPLEKETVNSIEVMQSLISHGGN